jgi:hypothetical protein
MKTAMVLLTGISLLGGLLIWTGNSEAGPGRFVTAGIGEPSAQHQYGRLPLSFEANDGQTDPQVKFLSRGRGYSLFLTPTEAVLSLSRRSSIPAPCSE